MFKDYVVGMAGSYRDLGETREPYEPAHIRSLIRKSLLAYGLGNTNPQAPLADIIKPGMTVLLKPNWVLHYNQNGGTMDCMVTHPNFVAEVLGEVLLAEPGRVIIGDAPIQLCRFEKLVPEVWRKSLQQRSDVPLEFIDFRRHRVLGQDLADGVEAEARPADRYSLFDLAHDSLLEPISAPAGRFRVTNYDPNALSQSHRPGRHLYLFCREAFEADAVINLPKLKTHRKAGITGALKNLVGLNGNKDYLPHHRVGGKMLGGDCYPGVAPLKRFAEFCLDQANKRINTSTYMKWRSRASKVLDIQRCFGDEEIEGSWYGNDTVWRMALDLNRIFLYGRATGALAATPQRQIYSLTDAVIAGQGDGPLAPDPLGMGVVTFAASSAFADLVHAGLLGFDYQRISLVREAFGRFRYPLTTFCPEKCVVRGGGEEMNWHEVAKKFGVNAKLPRGWNALRCENERY